MAKSRPSTMNGMTSSSPISSTAQTSTQVTTASPFRALRAECFDEETIDRRIVRSGAKRKFALDEIRRIPELANDCRDDLAIRREQRRVRGRHVSLQLLVQFGQLVVRNHREHVVFDVIVHVPIDE